MTQTSAAQTGTNDWYMSGTEDTGEYRVIGRSSLGRIGVRPLGSTRARVRVEPIDENAAASLSEHFLREDGWKQPGDSGQHRFSRVVSGEEGILVVLAAIQALGKPFERNCKARKWRRHLRP